MRNKKTSLRKKTDLNTEFNLTGAFKYYISTLGGWGV